MRLGLPDRRIRLLAATIGFKQSSSFFRTCLANSRTSESYGPPFSIVVLQEYCRNIEDYCRPPFERQLDGSHAAEIVDWPSVFDFDFLKSCAFFLDLLPSW